VALNGVDRLTQRQRTYNNALVCRWESLTAISTFPQGPALAGQIGEALSAAHQAGIVHRALKPENIMVTVQGRAKILDFELSRQSDTFLGKAEGGTKTIAVTQEGVLLGTLRYMSPEQARGKQPMPAAVFQLGRRVLRDANREARLLARLWSRYTFRRSERRSSGNAGYNSGRSPAHRFQSTRDLALAIHALSGSLQFSAPHRGKRHFTLTNEHIAAHFPYAKYDFEFRGINRSSH
jgi:serine/threonine protein kinase